MIRRSLLILSASLFWTFNFAQTSLEGSVIDKETGEAIIGATVLLKKGNTQITGNVTDFDGNYSLANIDPGTYTLEASYLGYQTQSIQNVVVLAGKSNKFNFKISPQGITLGAVEIIAYRAPLIEQDNTTQGGIVTAEKIKNLPTKNINALAATTAGLSTVDGGDISIRGSRTESTVYYQDGIRITGRSIPSADIEQLQVITGGIEAQYGDVLGGIISTTTKGPSSSFSGGVEAETSEFLDAFGYNLFNANVSGPIVKKSNGESLIGFRLSAQYANQKDDDPPATGIYRATEATIKRLTENPLTNIGSTQVPAGLYLKEGSDVERIDYNPNDRVKALDLTGKIDARLSKAVDVTFSGTLADVRDRFRPTDGNEYTGSGAWRLLNWDHNPMDEQRTYRGNLRIRHRLGKPVDLSSAPVEEGEETKSFSPFQNISYSLQGGYQNFQRERYDAVHKDNFFNHGFIGNFDVQWIPIFDENPFSESFNQHQGYVPLNFGYSAGNYNPAYANFNKLFASGEVLENVTSYPAFNGNVGSTFSSLWAGMHNNVGSVFNRYNKTNNDMYSGQIDLNMDFLPGGSAKGRHSLKIGGLFEQRVNRQWNISPFRLWEIGALYANNHIIGVDTNIIVRRDSLDRPLFQTLLADSEDAKFLYSLRKIIYPNLSENESKHLYANIDRLNPTDLSLDMFSAAELNDRGLLGYYGYDYLGNKLDNVTFEDFFKRDANGRRTFLVAPYRPTYASGYIQDKFSFKDIIFRVGLRADYFDANSKVLKDEYSLYPILGAKDFHTSANTTKPSTIGNDYKVYVTNQGSSTVRAYRNENQWYNAQGTPVNSARVIFGQNNLVYPVYLQPEESLRDIQGTAFNIDDSFEDYTPQVSIMPRLAFSFPISEDANFFAHYDVLVQRPGADQSVATALTYYYFNQVSENTPTYDNPNLKPQKTVDYEVGFQQKISNSSALKLAAYYKELRDLIQLKTLNQVATIGTYNTFGNLDFGTVKGFSLSYDLRRTNNIEVTAAYTLQFADGTGSDAESQSGLTSQGVNIRNIFPFSYDERHRFVATADYRYGSGKQYNGPRIGGVDFLANAGLNILLTTVSGRPYTQQTRATRFGGSGLEGAINGARFPWSFTVDLKADKNFQIANLGGKSPLLLNVYFRVQNLLNTKNIVGLYRASGDPKSDGYLQTENGANEINSVQTTYGNDALAYYLAAYNWRLTNPNNYSLPRRMFIGASLQF